MYKLIIVDDEDEVREGIRQRIDWKALGFELAGDFEHGRDALDALESLQPDVVITDICMPFMDGLELTRRIAEQYRDMKVVIVTGYEDFDYAKQAIQLKVKDYLLKPINAGEFSDFLTKLRQELDEERAKKEDFTALRLQLNQSMPLLRERFLERLATSRLKREDILSKLSYFQLTLPGPAYMSLVCDIDEFGLAPSGNPDLDKELLRFAAFNILQEIFEKEQGGLVFRTRDDKYGILLSGAPDEIGLRAQRLADHARQSIAKYAKVCISIGLGRVCTDLELLSSSFEEALSALDYRFLLGTSRIISLGDLEYGQGRSSVRSCDWEKKLLAAMKTGHTSVVTTVLSGWTEEMKGSARSVAGCYGSVNKLLAGLMNLVTETGFDETEVFGPNPFAELAGVKTIDDARDRLEETCRRIIAYLSEKRTDVAKTQMAQAEAYIRDNYADENFALNHVCSHIFMSISYFSSLFKQHTGETFIEYLTRIRMDKAKELLTMTPLKTYEIAERVGYGDPQYFSVIFKRVCGMSPKEYRSLMKGSTPA
ncbi:response regulator [Paenibacillus cremeus]|uniref:Response regulator n=1 Tax=Paenibacillus cremeus TaxID=2163881 RepID=A0A559K7P2_9BACL|nr:response regulator [Paenibacillus cremeus]TVY08149.1 response regulator [Paenibacillus cremeus]